MLTKIMRGSRHYVLSRIDRLLTRANPWEIEVMRYAYAITNKTLRGWPDLVARKYLTECQPTAALRLQPDHWMFLAGNTVRGTVTLPQDLGGSVKSIVIRLGDRDPYSLAVILIKMERISRHYHR